MPFLNYVAYRCTQWELVNGPDLLELLNECGGRMTEDAAAFYFVQLLEAVLYLHASGFCHRDIKPENCMVEQGTKRLKVSGDTKMLWRCKHLSKQSAAQLQGTSLCINCSTAYVGLTVNGMPVPITVICITWTPSAK